MQNMRELDLVLRLLWLWDNFRFYFVKPGVFQGRTLVQFYWNLLTTPQKCSKFQTCGSLGFPDQTLKRFQGAVLYTIHPTDAYECIYVPFGATNHHRRNSMLRVGGGEPCCCGFEGSTRGCSHPFSLTRPLP